MTFARSTRPFAPAMRSAVAPFMVMEVMADANRAQALGLDVLHLEVGEPGSGPPKAVLEAAKRALDSAPLGYTEALGMPALRARIAAHYRDWYGVEIDPARIAVTVGASGAFVLAFLAAFDVGQRVAVAEPTYPCYRNILQALGVEVVRLEPGPETGFQPDIALLERVEGRLDGLVVASPANPTGAMLGRARLERLARHCRACGIRLISDEIYHGITYGEPATSILEIDDDAIVVNGFSKFFCMTGWRIGWMVMPSDLAPAIERLAQNLFIAPPTPAQHGALAAFEAEDELRLNVARYARNRSLLLEALGQGNRLQVAPPEGAFYIYADIGAIADDSRALCRRLLEETGVAVTPGLDFDRERGHRFVRLSFAGSEAEVASAALRLGAWLEAQGA